VNISKGKKFLYESSSEDTCLVEYDDEPPHQINKDALYIALQVALLLNAKVVDEVQVMRKTVVLLNSIILGLFLSLNAYAINGSGSSNLEKINNFSTIIKINADASLDISEKIDYDFGTNSKHGIFRDIPILYQARGGNFNLRISDIGVKDENGYVYPFSESFAGNDISIKIGDANKLVSGKKTYIINYKIRRAINYFDFYDELYWNVTGNGWPVTIDNSEATVILPTGVAEEQMQKKCFADNLGENHLCLNDKYILKDNLVQSVVFTQNFPLAPGQGLTIVTGFPKGIVSTPSVIESYSEILKDNWIIVLPIITFFVMYYLWYTRGRDPKGRGTIIAQYGPPDNLMPSEVGTIIDEKVDDKDVSADIISLAVNGYLKITAIENKMGIFGTGDYYLEKLKEGNILQDFNKKLMEGLFRSGGKVKLPELNNNFYNDLGAIKDKIYQSTVAKGYFPENPQSVRSKYLLTGAAFIFISLFLSLFAEIFFGASGSYRSESLISSAIIILIFSFIMPAKTKKGVDAKEYILGFKEYMSVAEKDRINFHNAPEKNPERFEKLLPYAIALGVEKEWAKQFEGIYNQSPSWYSDSSGARFNSLVLANSLSNFSAVSNRSLSSLPPSSSHGGAAGGSSGFGSGGFSGGGFGGGGGGSW